MQNNLHYHQLYMPYIVQCGVSLASCPTWGAGSHWPGKYTYVGGLNTPT
jgi:hypothetical protein